MSKRRVLVTGGANGIGKTIASMYAEAGDQVFVLDKDKIELEAKDGSILFLQSDVRKEEQLKEAFHFIDKTYGPVDILINNAGISEFKPFLETTLVEWNNVIETNLTSVLSLLNWLQIKCVEHLSLVLLSILHRQEHLCQSRIQKLTRLQRVELMRLLMPWPFH